MLDLFQLCRWHKVSIYSLVHMYRLQIRCYASAILNCKYKKQGEGDES